YDQMSYPIPMPFSFNFYGTYFYQLFISSCGFITFEGEQNPGWGQQQPLPDPWTPNGLIAGLWSYLYPPAGGTIRYQTLGYPGNREFIIGFYDMPYCCEPGYFPVTFEIILHEGTNNIELQYGTAESPGYYTTVGIENFDGTEGLQVAYTYDLSYENEGFLIDHFAGSRTVGGLVGRNEATITDSYATTDVSGVDTVGGLVGFNSWRIINNCYSTGSVSGDYRVGGLVGVNDEGAVTNSFWDIETSGQTTSAGGTGKTTAEMYNTNTYMDAGWDFVGKPDGPSDIWAEPPSGPQPPPPGPAPGPGYPILWWQLSPVPELPTFSGGTGEPNDPYLISTADQLNSLGHSPRLMGAHFKLINDIDLTGVDFYVIGSQFYPYTGVFDGNGHVISNLTLTQTSSGENSVGLFGYVRGVIKNLGLVDPDIGAWAVDYVGSLVGWLSSGTITNCYVDGGSVFGSYNVGGLVGYNDYAGSISDCYSTAAASGTFAGGIAGWNYGTITDSYAEGDIDGYYYVGGLTGLNYGTVTDCHAAGGVSGYYYLGGLVGLNFGTVSYCYAEGDVGSIRGYRYVGGLVGWNEQGTIAYSYATGDVSGDEAVGGLVGNNGYAYSYEPDLGTVSNCYSTGSVDGFYSVGGLVGYNQSVASVLLNHTVSPIPNRLRNIRTTGTPVSLGDDQVSGAITVPFYFNFYATDFNEVYVSSNGFITFLPGQNSGCCSGRLLPNPYPYDPHGIIAGFWSDLWPPAAGATIRYQTRGEEGSREFIIGFYNVSHCCSNNNWPVTFEIILHEGTNNIELQYGLAEPTSWQTITAGIENFNGTDALLVAHGNVSLSYDGYLITIDGEPDIVGGVTKSYSTGSVLGFQNVGGLVGENEGTVYASFWDIETSGQTSNGSGTGLPTAQMQMAATFTDAVWDFTTPVWAIDEGVDYPHLWWELAPVMHAEPDITLWTSNTISWNPLTGASEYYVECAADANFTTIVYNTGWITETSCKFTGLESGKRYWYCVKARNSAAIESGWSNIESSQQFTLDDAVEMLLDPRSLKNRNMKNALLNKINAVFQMLDEGLYAEALDKLQHDILAKTNGCVLIGGPDRNDWIKTCEAQALIYPLIMETIDYVRDLLEQSLAQP
ncbi:MAG: GLUG motif-containing protein, partial [Planctomycetota bacterium]